MLRRLPLVAASLLVLILGPPARAGDLAALLAQSATVARGPGLYLNLFVFVPVVLLYIFWVWTTHWIEKDTKDLHNIYYVTPNLIAFGTGVLGIVLLWLIPVFWVGLVLLLLAVFVPLFIYIYQRNQFVEDDLDKVLTSYHLGEVANAVLGTMRIRPKFNLDVDPAAKLGPPLTFIGKSANSAQEDPSRVARAEESEEYFNAKELFYDAIQRRATDIMLDPTPEAYQVRYRIDGVMHTAQPFERPVGEGVLAVVKTLAALDVADRRKPQDGSFALKVENREVDVRVATSGSKAGEKLAARILDKGATVTTLAETGMRPKMIETIKEILGQPHGLLICTGPTGAGKSTTVYACLREVDRFLRNVISLEDPIEYQIDNVSQIEVNTKAGEDFATKLRSVIRQQPDIIMLGEVREAETAQVAVQAATGGQLVITTLHATDSITALRRLLEYGVEPNTMASALTGILSQRLVRVLCETCKEPYKPKPEFLRKANLPPDKVDVFYKPPEAPEQVCPACGGNGYVGRTGIFELLLANEPVRALIRAGAPDNAIKAEARKAGMIYLNEDGLRQVIQGRTSIEELLRVVK